MSLLSLDNLLRTTDTSTEDGATPAPAPNFSAPSIASAAMLVEVSFSQWTASKKDKRATEELLRQHNAKSGTVNANKSLLPGVKALDDIKSFVARTRGLVYGSTLPWTDTGIRLLPTAHYFKFQEQITGLQNEFDTLVNEFISAYQWERDKAQATLGSLWRAEDYPSVESARSKFAFKVNYMPVPDTGDWRVDIANQGGDALRDHYQNYFDSRLKLITGDVYEKFSERVTRLINSMDWGEGEKAKRMYQSTFDAVCELIDTMQSFNLTGDTTMEALRKQLATVMDGVSLEAIKEDHALRAEKKQQLEQAVKSLPSLDWQTTNYNYADA